MIDTNTNKHNSNQCVSHRTAHPALNYLLTALFYGRPFIGLFILIFCRCAAQMLRNAGAGPHHNAGLQGSADNALIVAGKLFDTCYMCFGSSYLQTTRPFHMNLTPGKNPFYFVYIRNIIDVLEYGL